MTDKEEKAVLDLICLDSRDAEEERRISLVLREERIERFLNEIGYEDGVVYPFESLHTLADYVASNGVLQSCCELKATLIAGLGFDTKNSPYTQDDASDSDHWSMKEWIRELFQPSFQTVAENSRLDCEIFGCGLWLVAENLVKRARFNGKDVGPEVHKITHLNRLHAQPLKPREIEINVPVEFSGGKVIRSEKITVADPADVEYPRWVIGSGKNKRYARTFGDPRWINKYTGETGPNHYGRSFTGQSIVVPFKYYFPKHEYGLPSWHAERKSLDIIWEIARYEWGHFRNNCMPNLVAIIPQIEVKGGGTVGGKFKEFLRDTSAQRAAGEDTRKVITVEVPLRELSRIQGAGNLKWIIQEVKGPDPNLFLDLEKRKNQLVALVTRIPPRLVHAEAGALGSGKEIEAALSYLTQTVTTPAQSKFETDIMDKLVRRSGIENVVVRMKKLDLSDPEVEARVADMWDKIRSISIQEKREKVGITAPIDPDDEKRSQRIGKVFLFGAQDSFWDIDMLEKAIDEYLTRSDPNDDSSESQEADPESLPPGERIAKVIKGYFGNDLEPSDIRTVLSALQTEVLPHVKRLQGVTA